jgi:hypothetical protein
MLFVSAVVIVVMMTFRMTTFLRMFREASLTFGI